MKYKREWNWIQTSNKKFPSLQIPNEPMKSSRGLKTTSQISNEDEVTRKNELKNIDKNSTLLALSHP